MRERKAMASWNSQARETAENRLKNARTPEN
jgi:hypothetical protein